MKVLVFGTFDIFHEGHKHFLQSAKEYGNTLHVVVALDETVRRVKGRAPYNSQSKRLAVIQAQPEVTEARLGNRGDKYKCIEDISPDIIVLGYDQTHFLNKLDDELEKRGLDVFIVQLKEGYKIDTCKSSKLRPDL